MENVKIEFKKIQEMDGHECLAYRADLYVNGKFAGDIYNDGNGSDYMFCGHNGPYYDIEGALNKFAKTDEFCNMRIYPYDFDPKLNRFNDLEDIYYHYRDVKFLKKYFKRIIAKTIKTNNVPENRALGLVVLSWVENFQTWLDSFPYYDDSDVSFKKAFEKMLTKSNALNAKSIKTKISIFPDLESIDNLLCFNLEEVK